MGAWAAIRTRSGLVLVGEFALKFQQLADQRQTLILGDGLLGGFVVVHRGTLLLCCDPGPAFVGEAGVRLFGLLVPRVGGSRGRDRRQLGGLLGRLLGGVHRGRDDHRNL